MDLRKGARKSRDNHVRQMMSATNWRLATLYFLVLSGTDYLRHSSKNLAIGCVTALQVGRCNNVLLLHVMVTIMKKNN